MSAIAMGMKKIVAWMEANPQISIREVRITTWAGPGPVAHVDVAGDTGDGGVRAVATATVALDPYREITVVTRQQHPTITLEAAGKVDGMYVTVQRDISLPVAGAVLERLGIQPGQDGEFHNIRVSKLVAGHPEWAPTEPEEPPRLGPGVSVYEVGALL